MGYAITTLNFIKGFDSLGFSIPFVGQEVANIFMGTLWDSITESEFVGGVADLYLNKRNEYPVVNTTHGQVKGFTTTTSRDGKAYAAYLGIPYAAPPIGNLRFKAPVEAQPWEEVRDGTKESHTCLTFREPNKGNEDCLYLNVFTPAVNSLDTLNRAVMVFIHGGAFMGGSSNTSGYAPDFLIDKDVVVVTFNYRLGPLGFLSLQNRNVPGNAGLKDQTMALRWVKKNAQNFGGDPSRVTIFGESAGAASVGYHVISPKSAGLFDRAIMESGTPLSNWAYTEPEVAFEKAFLLGSRVGCTYPAYRNQTDDLYQCLRDTPGPLLMRVQQAGLSWEELLALRPLAFVPTAEPSGPEAQITKSPEKSLQLGEFNKVPILSGINTAEGLLFYPALRKVDPTGMLVTFLGHDLTRLAPRDIELTSSSPYITEINQRMKAFYTGRSGPTNMATALEFLQIISDAQFLVPFLRTADYIQANSEERIYNYVFSFDGRYACYKAKEQMENIPGTCHMDELGYLFNLGPLEKTYDHSDRSRPEEQVIDLMTSIWAQFAATGNPDATSSWQPFSREATHYCDIGTSMNNKKSVQKNAVSFWNDIYYLVRHERPLPE